MVIVNFCVGAHDGRMTTNDTTIRHELRLTADTEAARAAVVSLDGIRGWWAKDATSTGEEPGSEHVLRFVKGDRTVAMTFRVDAVEDDRVTWTCTDNGNPIWPGTTLTWRIEALAGRDGVGTDGDRGTRVVFEHAGFRVSADHPAYAMTVEGWRHFVDSLRSYVETGAGEPW